MAGTASGRGALTTLVARRSVARRFRTAFRLPSRAPPLLFRSAAFAGRTAADLEVVSATGRPVRDAGRRALACFGMFAAPASLSGRRRRRMVEDFPDLLHEIFGKTGLGDKGITTGAFRAFRDASERVPGQRDDGD